MIEIYLLAITCLNLIAYVYVMNVKCLVKHFNDGCMYEEKEPLNSL